MLGYAQCRDAPGTFTANPEDAGMFYQWNRNVGWSATDPLVSTDGSAWDSNAAAGTTWETTNNVCPAGYRLPTRAEQQSLASAGSVWITVNGVNGCIFGNGVNTIFLPAPGYRDYYSTLFNAGTYGEYWSSTTNGNYSYYLIFYSSSVYIANLPNRASGFSVRCVAE